MTLRVLLYVFALVEFVYFSLSHWFAPELFFTSLGIDPSEVASPFVRSQLQLIGVMVMGYSLVNLVVARNPARNREAMAVVLFVGVGAVLVFLGNVSLGLLPRAFAVNAAMLLAQLAIVAWQFPWRAAAS